MPAIPIWIWLLGALFFVPKLYYILQVGRRKKGEIQFRLRRTAVGMIGYIGGLVALVKLGYRPFEGVAFGFVLAIALAFYFVPRPNRSRVIPKHIRRAVIQRDLKGAQFDSTIHHIDHIVPYSKGGDHSLANLRVIRKTENLQRGARSPELRDFILSKRRS